MKTNMIHVHDIYDFNYLWLRTPSQPDGVKCFGEIKQLQLHVNKTIASQH